MEVNKNNEGQGLVPENGGGNPNRGLLPDAIQDLLLQYRDAKVTDVKISEDIVGITYTHSGKTEGIYLHAGQLIAASKYLLNFAFRTQPGSQPDSYTYCKTHQ